MSISEFFRAHSHLKSFYMGSRGDRPTATKYWDAIPAIGPFIYSKGPVFLLVLKHLLDRYATIC